MKCELSKTLCVDTPTRAVVTGFSVAIPAALFAAMVHFGSQARPYYTAIAAVLGGGGGFAVRWSLQGPNVERPAEPASSTTPASESSSTASAESTESASTQSASESSSDSKARLPTVILAADGIQAATEVAKADPEAVGALVEWTDAKAKRAVIEHEGTRLEMVLEDMLKQDVDAIVNAANGALQLGSGVAGAIRQADEGKPKSRLGRRVKGQIQKECDAIIASTKRLQDGSVAATSSGKIPNCQEVLHAVGPVYSRKDPDKSARLLYQAYYNTLTLAAERGQKRVAIPYLSSAIFGYFPRLGSSRVALRATQDFMRDHPGRLECIRFCALPSQPEGHHAMLAEVQNTYSS